MELTDSPGSSIDGSLADFLERQGIGGGGGGGGGGRGVGRERNDVDTNDDEDDDVGGGDEDFLEEEGADDEFFVSNSLSTEEETALYSKGTMSATREVPLKYTGLDTVELLLPSVFKVNFLLNSKGYEPLEMSKRDIDASKKMSVYLVDAWAESISTCLSELHERLDSHSSAVKNASMSVRQQEISRDALEMRLKDLQDKLLDADKKARASEAKIKKLEEAGEKKSRDKKSEESDAKKMILNMKEKMAECERRMRQRDIENERLKDKLRVIAEKEKEVHSKHKLTLMGMGLKRSPGGGGSEVSFSSALSGRSGRTSASGGVKSPLRDTTFRSSLAGDGRNEIIEALESQCASLERDNSELGAQVSELTRALKDAQNGLSPSNSGHRESSEEGQGEDEQEKGEKSETARAMYEKIREQSKKIDQLLQRCDQHRASEAEKVVGLDQLRARNDELRDEIENLRIEMEARPTVRQWTEKQRELTDAEDKLHDLVMMRGEAAELAAWRKHLSTKDRIKVDKRNHELGLWLLDSLPKAVTKEVLQSVCRELDVSDVSDVQPSLAKLKAVVKAVPRMERFISQVCTFLFERDRSIRELKGRGLGGRDRPTMEDVLPVLSNWWNALQKLDNMLSFQDAVVREIRRREQLLAQAQGLIQGVVETHSSLGGHYKWSEQDASKTIGVIHDMVDFQCQVFRHKKSFRAAEDFIRDQPDAMVNRHVSHIQYLFDITSLDGLLPRMNQVYLFSEEMKNFLCSIRSSLKMKGASDAVVITETLRLIETLTGKEDREE